MSVFAIADLHLSLDTNKPMDVFGKRWDGYVDKLQQHWQETVSKDDTVIIPGDISWSTYLEECFKDFDFINRLNGNKIILKGNHDYWWTTASKLSAYIQKNSFNTISFLHNDAFLMEGISICGSRSWITPKTDNASAEDVKIYNRELARIRLSLDYANKMFPGTEKIVFVHYPPFSNQKELDMAFINLVCEYDVKRIVYGHLHADAHAFSINESVDGIEFKLVSADFINFKPHFLY